MGMGMSFIGKGWSPTQLIRFDIGTLHRQFLERNIKNFDDFHSAILDMFVAFNSALPGKHYDVPPAKEIETCFYEWKEAEDASRKRTVLVEFMKKRTTLSKLDNYTLMIGILTPPVAMAAKRAGESVPQIKPLKAIPDAIFVPGFTIVTLVCTKLTRRMFQRGFADSAKKIQEVVQLAAETTVEKKTEDIGPDDKSQSTGPTKVQKVKTQVGKKPWFNGPSEVQKVSDES